MIIELTQDQVKDLKTAEARMVEAQTAYVEARDVLRKKMLLVVAKGGGKTKTPQGHPISWELMVDESVLVSID